MLEVETAHLGQRVDEAVERSGGRGREEQEDGLRADVCEEARATKTVIRGVAATIEENEPTESEADVEEGIAHVEPVHRSRKAEQGTLHARLEVESDAPSRATMRPAFRLARSRPSRWRTSLRTSR